MSTYRIISAERASFPVSVMCEVLGVSRSGFHGWVSRAPSNRELSDAWLTSRITEIHERARGVYVSRRVQAELRLGQDIQVSRRRVRRLMRAAGISGLVKVKRGRTTIRVPGVGVADDLVERQFRPSKHPPSGAPRRGNAYRSARLDELDPPRAGRFDILIGQQGHFAAQTEPNRAESRLIPVGCPRLENVPSTGIAEQ